MIKKIFFFLLLLAYSCCSNAEEDFEYYMLVQINNTKSDFIDYMVEQYNFDQEELSKLIFNAKYLPEVIQKIEEAKGNKNVWNLYHKLFVNDQRASNGCRYWQKHANALNYAEKQFGVDSNIIAAIVGVETDYGTKQGNFSVLDALNTLAFYYPQRSTFFKSELAQYLVLTRELKVDPRSIYGSYAGAIGFPQFMPSSYRHYAVSLQKKKQADLINDTDDVILSVANFLQKAGWQANNPVAVRAQITGKKYQEIMNEDLKTNFTLGVLKKYNINTKLSLPNETAANLIVLTNKNITSYWLGLHNFYTITQYNHNKYYAMAVYQLSEKIKGCH